MVLSPTRIRTRSPETGDVPELQPEKRRLSIHRLDRIAMEKPVRLEVAGDCAYESVIVVIECLKVKV
jgi:hypothetical protein